MLVYEGIKSNFLLDVINDTITDKIHKRYQKFFEKAAKHK